MSIRGQNAFRMLLVSLVLVFSLNSVASAADNNFGEWELQVIHRFSLLEDKLSNIYSELNDQGLSLDSIDSFIETCSSLLGDIKSNLYYNGKSAAYYLYEIQNYVNASVSQLLLSNSYLSKIESHLATIANNSGSSDGSSSVTDLTEVLSRFDTLTGLIGIIQLRADTLISQLESTNTYLSAVSTKLDGVSTMVTSLNTATTYLSRIDSDVEDVLESLETATGLIGTISLDTDALVTGMGVTQDLIAAANTNLTTMINKQELTFDYLADLSGDLGTVISKQNSVLSALETVNQSLTSVTNRLLYDGGSLAYWTYRINHFLRNDFTEKLDTVISLLNHDNGSIAQLVNDFKLTTYLNMALMMDELSETNAELDSLHTALSFYFSNPNSALLDRLDAILGNQPNIDPIIWNQESVIAMIEQLLILEEEPFTYILHDMRTYLSSALSNDELIGGKLDSVSETLSTISDRLYYVDASLSYYVWNISYQLRNNLPILIANQEATIGNQEKLIDLIEDLELTTNVTIENIENITIDVTNKAYEVFYITDSEGNEQNLADFSGDVLTISGRLLNFFFKVAFDDALDSVDSALDDMTEFYIDDSVLVGGGSLWE